MFGDDGEMSKDVLFDQARPEGVCDPQYGHTNTTQTLLLSLAWLTDDQNTVLATLREDDVDATIPDCV